MSIGDWRTPTSPFAAVPQVPNGTATSPQAGGPIGDAGSWFQAWATVTHGAAASTAAIAAENSASLLMVLPPRTVHEDVDCDGARTSPRRRGGAQPPIG